MKPEIHFARSGDVHIAYQVVGDGPADLVWIPDWLWNLELQWEQPIVATLAPGCERYSRRDGTHIRASALPDTGGRAWATSTRRS